MELAVSWVGFALGEHPSYPDKYVLTLEQASSVPVLLAAGPEGSP